VTVPGGDHIGGDARRAHPGDIRVPQLAQRDRLESTRYIAAPNMRPRTLCTRS
jgi:hypothetical protein